MQPSRLSLAVNAGLFVMPKDGGVLVFRPPGNTDLSALPQARVIAVQGFRPDYDSLAAHGYTVEPVVPAGHVSAAVVFVPRSKSEARALVAAAAKAVSPGGPIAIDGQKTDGVDSLLKEIRARTKVGETIAKAHGKIAVFANPGTGPFADWAEGTPRRLSGGYVTRAAAFSSDGVDPGSAALAAALPAKLSGRVADFGAGWGYLSAEVLKREGVQEVHVVEAEHDALEAAKANLADPRAHFHWADATRFTPKASFGAIVMNPPFHTGRAADPGLGRAFIASAASTLVPSGTLWMVANRHLPYERKLRELFRNVEELPGPPAYKLYRASGPRTEPRTRR